MERSTKKALGLTAGVVALVLLSAGASALIVKEMDRPEPPAAVHHIVKNEKVHWNSQRQVQAAPAPARIEPAAGNCDDNNIVGTGLGGVVGGVAGSQVGKGDGKTAATIAGTLGGAYLGNQVIPTRNVTCK